MPRDDERPSPGPPGRPPSSNPGALPFPPDPRSCVRLPGLRGDGAGRRFGRPAARQHAAERDRCRADAPRAALDAVRHDVSMLIDSGANPTVIPVDTDGRVRTLLKRALALLGTPYRWGGSTTDGFDCSGLVGYVFRSALGIELPRVSRQDRKSTRLNSSH